MMLKEERMKVPPRDYLSLWTWTYACFALAFVTCGAVDHERPGRLIIFSCAAMFCARQWARCTNHILQIDRNTILSYIASHPGCTPLQISDGNGRLSIPEIYVHIEDFERRGDIAVDRQTTIENGKTRERLYLRRIKNGRSI